MSELSSIPSNKEVAFFVSRAVGEECRTVERFPTGLCHYVYGVVTTSDRRVVIRIAQPENRPYLEGALYWYEKLCPLGVPLPALISSDLNGPRAYMIIEWLPGEDLDLCYEQLSNEQKERLAGEIVRIQQAVHQLPRAKGFGYAFSYDDPALKTDGDWWAVQVAAVDRAERWIREGQVCSDEPVNRVRAALETHRGYFESVQPTPFLDDTTTKNVLVDQGRLTGIVDVDSVCFGDPLQTVALTRMSLWAQSRAMDYIEYWKACLELDEQQNRALDLYTAMYCVIFMGELGMQFNKATRPVVDPQRLTHYQGILDALLTDCP